MLYAFELGRKKKICLMELKTVLGAEKYQYTSSGLAFFDLDNQSPSQLQDRLGGTIKIIQVDASFPLTESLQAEQKIKTSLESLFIKFFEERDGKIPFSLNIYDEKKSLSTSTKDILNFSKKFLKSLGLNSRFVNKDFRRNPKPSTIYKARVLNKGIDLNIMITRDNLHIGHGVSIQNINNYSKRDFEKPVRDDRIGMLPPKLAQTLINLAGPSETILDPFCGTGTILMEAMLMGKDAIGSDLSPEMYQASQTNCEWFQREFPTDGKFRVFQKDARLLSPKSVPEKIDAIATEGYLGPAVSRLPSEEQREVTFRELANLHLNWLTAVRTILKPGAKVATCVAAYKEKSHFHHLPKFSQIADTAGYKILDQATYDRPDQIVARDIKILEKIG